MSLLRFLDSILGLYEFGLILYVLCSWILHPAAYALRRWLACAYEPVLAPMRRWIRAPVIGGTAIDLSPIVLWIGLGLMRRLVFAIFG